MFFLFKLIRSFCLWMILVVMIGIPYAQPQTIPDSWADELFTNTEGVRYLPEFDDAYGAAFRDINHDGMPDLYVTRFRNLNRLFIHGSGTSTGCSLIRVSVSRSVTVRYGRDWAATWHRAGR
jgi:hypothetical protein